MEHTHGIAWVLQEEEGERPAALPPGLGEPFHVSGTRLI